MFDFCVFPGFTLSIRVMHEFPRREGEDLPLSALVHALLIHLILTTTVLGNLEFPLAVIF